MNKMVSVIIPNYNRADYLKQALTSVTAQTYQDWEVIVVDDGSIDTSKYVVQQLIKEDGRIRFIDRHEKAEGAASCRNIGIDAANGDYLIFLDSDDLLAPYCLKQRIDVMALNHHLDFAVFKMQFFNETPGDDTRVWNLETEEHTLERFLKLDSVWQTSGPIWKLAALKKIKGFNPILACWQDIDIHLKALFADLNYKICYDLPADCYYRKNAIDSISQSNTNSFDKLKSKIELFHWAQPQAQTRGLEVERMAIHILFSALNGQHFKLYQTFYNSVKSHLPNNLKYSLLKAVLIKKLRLYKLPGIQSKYTQLKSEMISENSIGTFHV